MARFRTTTGVLIMLPGWGGDAYGFLSRAVLYRAEGELRGAGPWTCGTDHFRIIEVPEQHADTLKCEGLPTDRVMGNAMRSVSC